MPTARLLRTGLGRIALLAALAGSTAHAQGRQPTAILTLRDAGVTLTEPFSRVSSIRELGDGRVLVTDEKETRLVVADLARQSVVPVGRRGQGPGEYRQLGRAWALGADSTLIKEPYSPRWLLLDGARIVATLGPADPAVAAFGPLVLLSGASAGDALLAVTFGRDAAGRPSMLDSLVLQRLARRTARLDKIGQLRSADAWSAAAGVAARPAVAAAAGGGAPARRSYSFGIQVPDQALMFADGWIAIARAKPYRVDWCTPEGRCSAGPAIGAPIVRLTDREKRAYLAAAQRMQAWPPTTDPADVFGWPEELPPFALPQSRLDGGALWAMPDGRLLIERIPTADAPSRRYDIVDRTGRVGAQLQLDLTRRVVGFGVRHVYVVDLDDDGLERVVRIPWPPR